MLAAVTDKLGFAVTLSATYYPPYMAVRKLSTLDHLTKGRIGWNIVTSVGKGLIPSCAPSPLGGEGWGEGDTGSRKGQPQGVAPT